MHNNKFTKTYFLKDIHHTFRRNPKNQLQVNISQGIEYRSREDFINLLYDKLRESHQRQIQISTKKLSQLDDEKQNLLQSNEISLERLLKNL
jgi:SwaI restriction endonuclease